jgi:hypothetical protein
VPIPALTGGAELRVGPGQLLRCAGERGQGRFKLSQSLILAADLLFLGVDLRLLAL